jgi:hypothetical protein
MNGYNHNGITRSERIKQALMLFCALIFFGLGVLLLIEPQDRGSEFHSSIRSTSLGSGALVDNVDANSSFALGRVNGAYRK